MADASAREQHARIEEQLRCIRRDMDSLRQLDVAILQQLVFVKRAVDDICRPSRPRLFRSVTVGVQLQPAKRSFGSQISNPIDGSHTAWPRPRHDADGNLNAFTSEGHLPTSYGSDCSDDDCSSPVRRSSPGAAARVDGGGGGGAEQRPLSGTRTEKSCQSSSFYEDMLRRNVKIWKTVQLIKTRRCDTEGLKLWP